MKDLISVIILNWNRKNDTLFLIKKLQNQTYKNFEILVVDNNSTDKSIQEIKKKFSSVIVVALDKNYGLYGFNKGMEKAKGKYFLLLASDAVVPNNLIAKHSEKMKNNTRLGVSCATTYTWPDKTYQAPNRSKKGNNTIGYEVTYFDGNGICVRREVFKKTLGYPKEYFICLEELKWAVEILQAGWDIRCFTDVVVYNKKSIIGGNYRSRQGYWYCRNWIWFYMQYLPLSVMKDFFSLHIRSFQKKTDNKKGYMRKRDCFLGLLVSILLLPNIIQKRKPLSEELVDRIKRDLFPNKEHLYIQQ